MFDHAWIVLPAISAIPIRRFHTQMTAESLLEEHISLQLDDSPAFFSPRAPASLMLKDQCPPSPPSSPPEDPEKREDTAHDGGESFNIKSSQLVTVDVTLLRGAGLKAADRNGEIAAPRIACGICSLNAFPRA